MKVLLVVIKGFHLGYIGCYGNEWISTPTLDRLAADGIVFDQHYADHPTTAGGRLAWQTGCYSFPWPEWVESLPTKPAASDLYSRLKEQGIRIDSIAPEPADAAPLPGGMEATLKRSQRKLASLSSREHWLLRAEFDVLLPPWKVPEQFREEYFTEEETDVEPLAPGEVDDSLESCQVAVPGLAEVQKEYAAAVTYLDAGLEQLFTGLKEGASGKDVLVVVTGDRGQAIDDRRRDEPGKTTLHEELMHIPLLVCFPDGQGAGRRISALTQSLDLMPTFFDLFGLPVPEAHGRSLLPLMLGKSAKVRDYACAGLRARDRIEWALRAPEWGFLLPMRAPSTGPPLASELYVKPDDRWEVNNARQHHVVLAESIEQTLWSFVRATRDPGPLQPPDLCLEENKRTENAQTSEGEPL